MIKYFSFLKIQKKKKRKVYKFFEKKEISKKSELDYWIDKDVI